MGGHVRCRIDHSLNHEVFCIRAGGLAPLHATDIRLHQIDALAGLGDQINQLIRTTSTNTRFGSAINCSPHLVWRRNSGEPVTSILVLEDVDARPVPAIGCCGFKYRASYTVFSEAQTIRGCVIPDVVFQIDRFFQPNKLPRQFCSLRVVPLDRLRDVIPRKVGRDMCWSHGRIDRPGGGRASSCAAKNIPVESDAAELLVYIVPSDHAIDHIGHKLNDSIDQLVEL